MVDIRTNSYMGTLWSDNESDVDLLRFSYLAAEVADIVSNQRLLPVTVGIYGDWGSGKSTLMKMVELDLRNRPNTLVLQFNGWLFEGYEDAKSALMGSILDAIGEQAESGKSLTDKGKDLLKKLAGRVNWMNVASSAVKYAAPTLLGMPYVSLGFVAADLKSLKDKAAAGNLQSAEVQKFLDEMPEDAGETRKNIREFRQDFSDLLAEAEIQSLVVFIDDLDRCLPTTIIDTLEAIKLFLFVPHTAFVLGADERLVQYAVRQRFPELSGTETDVGRDYLEKLVQIAVRVPPLTASDIESYMNLLFAEYRLDQAVYDEVCCGLGEINHENALAPAFDLERAGKTISGDQLEPLKDDFDLTAQIVPILTSGLSGNPRRAKRFLNLLMLRLSLSERRGLHLERRILSKLMLLEYIRPEFFRDLGKWQLEAGGKPSALSELEASVRADRTPEPDVSSDDSEEDGAEASNPKKQKPGTAKQSRTLENERRSHRTLEDSLPWLADDWTKDWLFSEPYLSDVDLAPYFFIAHDKLGIISDTGSRLSHSALAVLNRLLSEGEVSQSRGLKDAEELNSPDALAVFEQLVTRLRRSEVLDERSPNSILTKYVGVRSELLPQYIAAYGNLPDAKISAPVPMQLLSVTRDTPTQQAADSLIARWARSSNPRLKASAGSALMRIASKG